VSTVVAVNDGTILAGSGREALVSIGRIDDASGRVVSLTRGGVRTFASLATDRCRTVIAELRVTGPSVPLIQDTGIVGERPALSHDGGQLAYGRANGGGACAAPDTLIVRDVETRQERRATFDRHSILGLAWSGDDATLAVLLQDDAGVPSVVSVRPAVGLDARTDFPIRALAEGARVSIIAWKGDRLVGNVVCCATPYDEQAAVDLATGDIVLTPQRECPAGRLAAESGSPGRSTSTIVKTSTCQVLDLAFDQAGSRAVYRDEYGNVFAWDASGSRRVYDAVNGTATAATAG
jgi:hypothetical protein